MEQEIDRAALEEQFKQALVEGMPEEAPIENDNSNQTKVEDTSKVEDSKETPKAEDSGNQQDDFLKTRNEILEKAADQKEAEIINEKRAKELEQEPAPKEVDDSKDDVEAIIEKKLAERDAKHKQELEKMDKFNNLVNDYIKSNPADAELTQDIRKIMEVHPTLTPKAAALLAKSSRPNSQNITVGNPNPSLRDSDKPLDKMSLEDMRKSPELQAELRAMGF
jgi:hypothetical protein